LERVQIRVYFGGFFLVLAASMTVTTFMLCLVVKARPSKTDPYNTAMIVSHAITLCAAGLVLRSCPGPNV
jgi:hypothetical protein